MKKDNTPFERKSQFNLKRGSFLTEDFSYIYIRQTEVGNGKFKTERIAEIPYSKKIQNVLIALDDDDYSTDLKEQYIAKHTDYDFAYQRNVRDSEDGFDDNPIDAIPDGRGDVFDQIFPTEALENPDLQRAKEFVKTQLTLEQQKLFYKHLGEGKTLEDIRREEEAATGIKITKQAMNNRWQKIIAKACKFFGVVKPKKVYKTNK